MPSRCSSPRACSCTRQVYFHRTVRADRPRSCRGVRRQPSARFSASPVARSTTSTASSDLDEYALLHRAALWARRRGTWRATAGGRRHGEPRGATTDGWRAILLRRPRWRSEAEIRVEYEDGAPPVSELATLGPAVLGRIAIDLAVVDARPGTTASAGPLLAVNGARRLGRSRSAPGTRSPARLRPHCPPVPPPRGRDRLRPDRGSVQGRFGADRGRSGPIARRIIG